MSTTPVLDYPTPPASPAGVDDERRSVALYGSPVQGVKWHDLVNSLFASLYVLHSSRTRYDEVDPHFRCEQWSFSSSRRSGRVSFPEGGGEQLDRAKGEAGVARIVFDDTKCVFPLLRVPLRPHPAHPFLFS
jgi:hypothetical protein